MNKKKFIKGSAILVVIMAAITSSVYMVSTFADYEHFDLMSKKYEDNVKKHYDEIINNKESIYNELENKIISESGYTLE